MYSLSFIKYLFLPDKTDNFSRSQSSSVSSLETVSKEIIQCLTFADSYIYKTGRVQYMIFTIYIFKVTGLF